MAGEYSAGITEFVSTVTVDHPRLGRVRMNFASYDPATCGEILEGPTVRENTEGLPVNRTSIHGSIAMATHCQCALAGLIWAAPGGLRGWIDDKPCHYPPPGDKQEE